MLFNGDKLRIFKWNGLCFINCHSVYCIIEVVHVFSYLGFTQVTSCNWLLFFVINH